MKRIITVFISVFSLCLLQASESPTVVSGQMKALAENYFVINKLEIHPQFDTIFLDAEKKFRYEVVLDSSTYFELRSGNTIVELFLEKDKNLQIRFDSGDFGTSFVYENQMATYNEYLQYSSDLQVVVKNDKRLFEGEFSAVFSKIDSLYRTQLKGLEAFKKIKNSYFLRVEKMKLEDARGDKLLQYIDVPKNLTGGDAAIYNEYYNNYFSNFQFDQPELVSFPVYQVLMLRVVHNHAKSMLEKSPEIKSGVGGVYTTYFNSIKTQAVNQEIKDYMYFYFIKDLLPRGNFAEALDVVTSFDAYSTDRINNTIVKQSVAYFIVPAIGSSVPEMTYLDIDSNAISISDFKGKYVYIDVWATWCGPCKREIPKLESLGHELEGKNIVFVSVSTDKNKASWERMVTQKNMHGVQLHAGPGGSISQVFRVTSIPRFILLDREGKVLNPIAPRPSHPGIKEYLLSLEGVN